MIFVTLTEICCNKWQPGASEISTPPEIAVTTHFHAQHGTKTTPVFLSADEKSLGCCFQVQSPYYQVAQCNQKTPIPAFSR